MLIIGLKFNVYFTLFYLHWNNLKTVIILEEITSQLLQLQVNDLDFEDADDNNEIENEMDIEIIVDDEDWIMNIRSDCIFIQF